MGSTHRFLAVGDDNDRVLDWFRGLSTRPEEASPEPRGRLLYFRDFGPLVFLQGPSQEIDPKASPVVSLFPARPIRGVLWTAGEVHFLATPLRKLYPRLEDVSRRFHEWLTQFDLVFSRRSPVGEWNYYLEGGIQNEDSDVFALPAAMNALRNGQYFVAESATPVQLDILCRALRLRGIE